jgi:hypothetical protein
MDIFINITKIVYWQYGKYKIYIKIIPDIKDVIQLVNTLSKS